MVKRFTALAVIIVIQTALAIFAGWAMLNGGSSGKILPGVTCAGIPLGGLTPGKADEVLREKLSNPDNMILTLVGEGRQWLIPMKETGAVYDFPEAVKKAFSIGRSGSVIRRVSELLGNRVEDASVPLPIRFDIKALRGELEKVSREYGTPPRNAQLVAENKKVKIVPSVSGREMDLGGTLARILELQAGPDLKVVIAAKDVLPTIGEGDVSGLSDLLGEFATLFEDWDPARINNITRAAAMIDGTLVRPGEVFSYNRCVSPVDLRGGYQKAPVIIDDLMVEDYGGGVCQVSTTLYGAVLYSGLEIVERHSHSIAVKYVTPGLDATVAEGFMDLRFRNNHSRPVYISASVQPEEGQVRIALIGNKEGAAEYKIERVLSRGVPGHDVMVYRVTMTGGGEEKRELISDDYYPPEPEADETETSPGDDRR